MFNYNTTHMWGNMFIFKFLFWKKCDVNMTKELTHVTAHYHVM